MGIERLSEADGSNRPRRAEVCCRKNQDQEVSAKEGEEEKYGEEGARKFELGAQPAFDAPKHDTNMLGHPWTTLLLDYCLRL